MTGPQQPSEAQILELVASGVDLDTLAARLNITARRALTLVDRAGRRAARLTPEAESQLQIELRHLDLLRRAFTPIALRGDADAGRLLIRIANLRARLLHIGQIGEDAPGSTAGPARRGPAPVDDHPEPANELDRQRRIHRARGA